MSTTGGFNKTGLAEIGLSPMHSITKNRLLAGRKQLTTLFHGQTEIVCQPFHNISNSDLTG